MKLDYKFSRVFGSKYRKGNLIFSNCSKYLIVPSCNFLNVFNLTNDETFTIDANSNYDLSFLAISPNSNILAAVNEHGILKFISIYNGSVLSTFQFPTKVNFLEFSPDGDFIAVGLGNLVKIYTSPSLHAEYAPISILRSYSASSSQVTHLSWSENSNAFVVGYLDANCRVFPVLKRKDQYVFTISLHRSAIKACFFLYNSLNVVSIDEDGVVYINYASISLETFSADNDTPLAYVNKKKFVTLGGNHGNIMPIDNIKVSACCMQKKSDLLFLGCTNGQVLVFLVPDMNLLKSYSLDKSERAITSFAVTGNSSEILSVGNEHTGDVTVFNWRLGSYLLEIKCDDENSAGCSQVVFSPDGLFLATCSEASFNIRYWLAHSGKAVAQLTGHTAGVKSIIFVPNKPNVLLSASLDGTVRAYDLKKYRNFRTMSVPSRQVQLSRLAVDQSGSLVMACASEFSGLFEGFIWSLDSALLLATITNHTGPISSLGFLPLAKKSDGNLALYTCSWDGNLRLWSLGDSAEKSESSSDMLTMTDCINCQQDIICTSICPTSNKAALGLINCQISIFDLDTGKEINFIDGRFDLGVSAKANETDVISAKRIANTAQHFLSLEYSCNGNLLLAGGHGKYICLYSAEDGILLKRFPVTINFSLSGVQEVFDRKRFIPTIPLSANSDVRNSMALPGVGDGDRFSKRWWRPTAKTTCISFSPCGYEFLASTTDSIVLFSRRNSFSVLNQNTKFFDITTGGGLSLDDTPSNCLKLLREEKYTHALVMSLALNDHKLIRKVVESTPQDKYIHLCSSIPFKMLVNCLLPFIAEEVSSISTKTKFTGDQLNVHLGLYTDLIYAFLTKNAISLRSYHNEKRISQHLEVTSESDKNNSHDTDQITASLIKLSSSIRAIKSKLVEPSERLNSALEFMTVQESICQ